MWNPLSLPLAALGAAASVPRALEAVARTPALLERAIAQAEDLNDSAADARQLLTAGLERMDAMNERADLVLEELAAAREVFAEAMERVDRLAEQGDRVIGQIAKSERLVAALTSGGDDLTGAARRATEEATEARAQLRETQAVLERASEQFGRALEMAEPLDRMTARAARIAGSLRRDPSGD